MSVSMDMETILQTCGVQYDDEFLASNRIMFAHMLKEYLRLAHCRHEELIEGDVSILHESHPMNAIFRTCVERAWAELEDHNGRKNFVAQMGGGGCSPSSCEVTSCSSCEPAEGVEEGASGASRQR